MNDEIGLKLITMLLDKYERSSFFSTGTMPTRRILLKLYENGNCEFSDYDIENGEQRIRINECVEALAQKGLLHFEWMKGEQHHILSNVWLNMDELQAIYCFAHRQPQSDFLSNVEAQLAECMESVGLQWIKDFLYDACEDLRKRRKLPTLLPKDAQDRQSLLLTLRYIDGNRDNELLKRLFSVRCFGDSKHFEQVVEARLLRILKKYLDCDEKTEDAQLLNQIGIAKYPEQLEFCGPMSLIFPNKSCLDFSKLGGGSVIYGQDLAKTQIAPLKDVGCILSIENKANYFDYICKHRKPDQLVIYHGGQYGPSKKVFLQALASASEQLPWYHWGDIDYGGFSMLARLRREVNANILPYRMNQEELITFAASTTSFSSGYSHKLSQLLTQAELKDCSKCLSHMLAHSVRLEQEALLE